MEGNKRFSNGRAADIQENPGKLFRTYLFTFKFDDSSRKRFLECPLIGEDSQAGTIVHEVSHLVAGTHDYAYGAVNCAALASNHPEKAIKNADSYEYFVEKK